MPDYTATQDRALRAALRDALRDAVGEEIVEARAVSGGDINEAWKLRLADGRPPFVKTNPRAPSDMFAAEAAGLGWLRDGEALRTPDVVAASEPGAPIAFLALEWIEAGPSSRRTMVDCGRGLAALHGSLADSFTPAYGLDHDNYIGRLPQSNAEGTSWSAFWRSQRLEPQLRQAVDSGAADSSDQRRFGRLFARLDELLGPEERPARLHGDLWGGNLLIAAGGEPCLIDPAGYAGSREVDLAMMRLFGGFGERCFDAYAEAWPLEPGHRERVGLYQLYYLLAHVNLFGGGWMRSVREAVKRYV